MITERFTLNIDQAIQMWHDTANLRLKRHKYSRLKQLLTYLKIKRSLKKVITLISENYLGDPSPNLNRLKAEPQLRQLISLWFEMDPLAFESALKGDFVTATEDFIHRVKTKWPQMPHEEIFQALRNVWIMVAIQMMAGREIMLTDAMFAYSMLYPLTDNLLDDANLSREEKGAFCNRLGGWLRGIPEKVNTEREQDIYEMIQLIEGQFARSKFPEVYESLLLIHEAQVKSLSPQQAPLNDTEMLRITFEKGASSVIADGYLVMGNLSDEAFTFLTLYGIVLQLADDLQDQSEDATVNHQTLFSRSSNFETSEQLTTRLIHFSKAALIKIFAPNEALKHHLTKLLEKSMDFLISDAIHTHRATYSSHYYRVISSGLKTGLRYHERLKTICRVQTAHWAEKWHS